jgi:hypothetical protein
MRNPAMGGENVPETDRQKDNNSVGRVPGAENAVLLVEPGLSFPKRRFNASPACSQRPNYVRHGVGAMG